MSDLKICFNLNKAYLPVSFTENYKMLIIYALAEGILILARSLHGILADICGP